MTTTECGTRPTHQPPGYQDAAAQCDSEALYDTRCRGFINMRPGIIIINGTINASSSEFQPNLLFYPCFHFVPILSVPTAVAERALRRRQAEGEDVMPASELAQRSS